LLFGTRASISAMRDGDEFTVQLRLPLDGGTPGGTA
jgi:hypothetical protein